MSSSFNETISKKIHQSNQITQQGLVDTASEQASRPVNELNRKHKLTHDHGPHYSMIRNYGM